MIIFSHIKLLIHFFILVIVFFPIFLFAQEVTYVPLAEIPGVTDGSATTIVDLLNGFYILAIIGGSLLAVIRIALAGTSYMMSDVITDKESAKKRISGALTGLLIILATFLLLNTIFPGLTNLDIFKRATGISTNTPVSQVSATPVRTTPYAECTRAAARNPSALNCQKFNTSATEVSEIETSSTENISTDTTRSGIFSNVEETGTGFTSEESCIAAGIDPTFCTSVPPQLESEGTSPTATGFIPRLCPEGYRFTERGCGI